MIFRLNDAGGSCFFAAVAASAYAKTMQGRGYMAAWMPCLREYHCAFRRKQKKIQKICEKSTFFVCYRQILVV